MRLRVQIEELPPEKLFSPELFRLAPTPLDCRVVVCLNESGFPLFREGPLRHCLYDPLDDGEKEGRDLLGRFGGLNFNRNEEIIRFFNDFGRVGYPSRWDYPGGDTPLDEPVYFPDRRDLRGEPVWWLKKQQQKLRLLSDVHAAWLKSDFQSLREIFGPVPEEARSYMRSDDTVRALCLACPSVRSMLLQQPALLAYFLMIDRGYWIVLPLCSDLTLFPDIHLRALTDEECSKYARALLKEHLDYHLRKLRREIAFPEKWGETLPAHVTNRLLSTWNYTCLLEAIYLRFHNAITGQVRMRHCLECRAPFELPYGKLGRSQNFCPSTIPGKRSTCASRYNTRNCRNRKHQSSEKPLPSSANKRSRTSTRQALRNQAGSSAPPQNH